MYFDFMKPEVWDGLVVIVTMIGLLLSVYQLIRNRASYREQQDNHSTSDIRID